MEQNKEFLGTEPIGKLLFKLAVPTVVAQLINMLYNLVDRIYIGHIPEVGTAALTGLGVCMPVIMIVSAFAMLVGAGGAPRASIALGRKEPEQAEKILGNCFILQLIISVILTAVLLIWNEDLMQAFGATPNALPYAVEYMNIYAFGTLFVQLTLGMNSFITAQGFTKVSMLSVILGAATNIILDPILIFGFHMGVRGAALATVISQSLSSVWVICFLMSKKSVIRLKPKNMGLRPKIILPCISLGAATFVMQASESVISICFNTSLRGYGGETAVGAMTILTSVMQFAMLPLQGIAMGSQPITSYNYGAGNVQRVKKTFRLLLMACLTYSTLLWAIIMINPGLFASIFSPDPKLIEYTAWALRIFMAVMFMFGAQIACQMTFTSIGSAMNSIIVAVVRKFVLLLPMIYLIPMLVENKVMGVYLAEPISDFLAVTFTVTLFSFQFRKALKKIEPKE